MTAGREDGTAGALGQLRTSHADREQAIDVLKAAFVQGRLTKDEFDLRVSQVFASRTYAALDAQTVGPCHQRGHRLDQYPPSLLASVTEVPAAK